MAFPAIKVEIAFDSTLRTPAVDRTWTDVSTYVDSPVDIQWGRSDELGQTEPSTCTVTLDNTDGRFTAGLVSSPYYPNVKLDRPIRVSVTPSGGSPSVRFVGYIDGWPAAWPDGTDVYATAAIGATSRLGRLGLRNAFYSDLTELGGSGGATVWPLNDPEGSTQGVSVNGLQTLRIAGSGTPATFVGTGVHLRGGQHLTSTVTLGSNYTVALSFFSTSRGGVDIMPVQTSNDSALVAANDGQWHRLVLTVAGGVPSGADMCLDGDPVSVTFVNVRTSNLTLGTLSPSAWIRDVAYYPSVISGGDIVDDFAAFNGGFGDMTDVRLVRYASYVDIPSAEVDADAGAVAMGATDIAGMDAASVFKVVESTEGGVLVDARDGSLRLIGRRARYGSSAAVTLSMATQQVERDFAPTLDRSGLRNMAVGTNAATNIGGVNIPAVSTTVRDQASIDEYGEVGMSIEINAAEPTEAYAAASWIVANHAQPKPHVPALALDFLPFNLSDQAALLGVFLGDRVAVSDLPSQAPDTAMEFFVEGGSESWDATSAFLRWNVSPVNLEDSVLIFDEPGHAWDAGYYFGL